MRAMEQQLSLIHISNPENAPNHPFPAHGHGRTPPQQLVLPAYFPLLLSPKNRKTFLPRRHTAVQGTKVSPWCHPNSKADKPPSFAMFHCMAHGCLSPVLRQGGFQRFRAPSLCCVAAEYSSRSSPVVLFIILPGTSLVKPHCSFSSGQSLSNPSRPAPSRGSTPQLWQYLWPPEYLSLIHI